MGECECMSQDIRIEDNPPVDESAERTLEEGESLFLSVITQTMESSLLLKQFGLGPTTIAFKMESF